jgi:hypothetical protein
MEYIDGEDLASFAPPHRTVASGQGARGGAPGSWLVLAFVAGSAV